MPTLDELVRALPDVGLKLWRFDQGDDGTYHVVLEDAQGDILAHPFGDDKDPVIAFTRALKLAGIQIDD